MSFRAICFLWVQDPSRCHVLHFVLKAPNSSQPFFIFYDFVIFETDFLECPAHEMRDDQVFSRSDSGYPFFFLVRNATETLSCPLLCVTSGCEFSISLGMLLLTPWSVWCWQCLPSFWLLFMQGFNILPCTPDTVCLWTCITLPSLASFLCFRSKSCQWPCLIFSSHRSHRKLSYQLWFCSPHLLTVAGGPQWHGVYWFMTVRNDIFFFLCSCHFSLSNLTDPVSSLLSYLQSLNWPSCYSWGHSEKQRLSMIVTVESMC